MKFSQKVKDIFDIVRAISSYIAILLFSFALYFAYSANSIKTEDIPKYLFPFGKIVAIFLVSLPFVLYLYDIIKIKYIIFRGKLSGFILEKHQLIIDISDSDGKNATFYQKIFFHKFSNNNKEQYLSNLSVSGTINAKSIQTLNCFYSLDSDQKSLNLSYVNNMKKLNKVPNFFKENDRFLIFYAHLENTFIDKKESWDIDVHNLCQDYNLQIFLPENKGVDNVKFLRVTNNEEKLVDNIQPIVIKLNNRYKIELQIMNFDKNDKYRVTWTLD
ncbi:hypothetical protein [Flavobacterium piscis]|uniref:SMODS-associating 2TM beta-strand rich effector domain-containing protein n=1 Tax=Flavobacterium piscis TaxID=1114874 RepID=A0ABU1Y5S5_9FLAO|nr:hypothetical protein [Flavobacterium piscis]MDR7209577.1 hypothetical protein [Flavobacterium piscis]